VVVVALLTTMTLLRNDDYRSEAALWGDVAAKAPHNPRAHYNHGVYLQIAGSTEEVDAAIAEYHETLRLDPHYADAYLNLGNLAAWRKQWSDAERYYAKLLELRPGDAAAQKGLDDARRQQAAETP
jgi:tetratricopeptide (TPR) repeat protein